MPRCLKPEVCANAAACMAMLAVCWNGSVSMAAAAQAKGAGALPDEPTSVHVLTVRLYDFAGVPAGILASAKRVSVQIFHEAGIELSWVSCPTSEGALKKSPAEFAACMQALFAPVVRIGVESNVGRLLPADSIVAGAAMGELVSVSYDRVERIHAKDQDIEKSTILGHVLAHELGHVLLGGNSHSSGGIMTARLQLRELRFAERGKLLFSGPEAAQMRAKTQVFELRAGTSIASDR
jgi:hypothetical protein